MNVDHLIRDKVKVHNALKEEGNSLVATKPLKVYFPESYLSSELGNLDHSLHSIAIFGIVVDDKYYATSSACAMCELAPSTTNTVSINGTSYLELHFAIGDKVMVHIDLVKSGPLVYRIYNEFIAKGKIPWYFTYKDLAFLFGTALSHGGANLRADSSLLELIASVLARQKKDKFLYFRHSPELLDLNADPKPVFIPLKSVSLNATSTSSKLLGNYFSEAVTGALITKTESTEDLEKLLRS